MKISGKNYIFLKIWIFREKFRFSDPNNLEWLAAMALDTATSLHFCNDKRLFENFVTIEEKLSVATAGVTYPIKGKGYDLIEIQEKKIKLRDVLYAPDLRKDLIPGPWLDYHNYMYFGKKWKVRVSFKQKNSFTATLKNNIHFLNILHKVVLNQLLMLTMFRWKYGIVSSHVSSELIENTCKYQEVKGLPSLTKNNFSCETC